MSLQQKNIATAPMNSETYRKQSTSTFSSKSSLGFHSSTPHILHMITRLSQIMTHPLRIQLEILLRILLQTRNIETHGPLIDFIRNPISIRNNRTPILSTIHRGVQYHPYPFVYSDDNCDEDTNQ